MEKSIFVAGDLHIPSRATMLPPQFRGILESQKWDYIILTGDYIVPRVLDNFNPYLRNLNNLIACKGNMDQFSLPEKPVHVILGHKIGVYHGTSIYPRGNIVQLKNIANEMNVRILFTGHSHQQFLYSDNEHIIINPGTSTGASGGSNWSVDTGLVTIILTSNELTINSYLIASNGKLKANKKKIFLD